MIARPFPFDRPIQCDPSQLRRLIADELNDGEMTAIAQHLDQCDQCRTALDRTSQYDSEWMETKSTIRMSLTEDAPTNVAPSSEGVKQDLNCRSNGSLMRWLEPCNPSQLQSGFVGKLDRFLIRRVVGTGGMGVVFEGWDEQLHRAVAIKAMHPHLASIAIARQRFVREARAAAAIVHPNVVAIHSVNAEFDPPYLVMPLIAGESLQTRIDRTGPLEMDSVLRIASQVVDGLAAAHEQGLVHRDVKPGNILVEHGTERALITDFGVVRALDDATMTTSGAIAGTPEYMSPEQARGDSLDHRSDLFSLGSVMYAMLVGRSPFRADSPLGVLRRITDDQPRAIRETNPHIPSWMVSMVDWLHEKNRSDRAHSTSEVASELKRALSHWHDPVHHPLPTTIANRMRTAWPRPMLILSVAVCGLVSFALVIGIAMYLQPAETRNDLDKQVRSEFLAVPSENLAEHGGNGQKESSHSLTYRNQPFVPIEIDEAIQSVSDEIDRIEASMTPRMINQ